MGIGVNNPLQDDSSENNEEKIEERVFYASVRGNLGALINEFHSLLSQLHQESEPSPDEASLEVPASTAQPSPSEEAVENNPQPSEAPMPQEMTEALEQALDEAADLFLQDATEPLWREVIRNGTLETLTMKQVNAWQEQMDGILSTSLVPSYLKIRTLLCNIAIYNEHKAAPAVMGIRPKQPSLDALTDLNYYADHRMNIAERIDLALNAMLLSNIIHPRFEELRFKGHEIIRPGAVERLTQEQADSLAEIISDVAGTDFAFEADLNNLVAFNLEKQQEKQDRQPRRPAGFTAPRSTAPARSV